MATVAADKRHTEEEKEEDCGCPHQCKLFEKISSDHGIMVMLVDPSSLNNGTSSSSSSPSDLNEKEDTVSSASKSPTERMLSTVKAGTTTKTSCSCLKLYPQPDSNLPQLHPNIYIPSSLLEFPEELVKYGGGGSGVTVFGGRHPQLGSLVMKHGGHKDLVELVSLVKIERELNVRGKWKMDCLEKTGGGGGRIDCSCGDGVGEDSEEMDSSGFDNIQSTNVTKPNTSIIKRASQPILTRMGTMFRLGSRGTRSVDSLPKAGGRNDVQSTKSTATQLEETTSMVTKIGNVFLSEHIDETAHLASDEQYNSANNGDNNSYKKQMKEIQSAMDDMKRRIPAFRMIYISPMHLRERKEELVNNTFRTSRKLSLRNCDGYAEFDGFKASQHEQSNNGNGGNYHRDSLRKHSVSRKGRPISLFGASHTKSASLRVHPKHVDLCFGGSYRPWRSPEEEKFDDNHKAHSCISDVDGSDGYGSLIAFVKELHYHQQHNDWKLTLAQQTIGRSLSDPSKSATTASSLLVKGKLRGPLLNHLIDEEIRVIRNLQLLTMPEEVEVVHQVRQEYEDIITRQKDGSCVTAADVSPDANMFVGRAIHKNFDPINGRFVMLSQFALDLRMGRIHLKPKEVLPAKHLGNLFHTYLEEKGMDKVYVYEKLEGSFIFFGNESGSEHFYLHREQNHPIFASGMDQWQSLLELSLSMKSPNATNRIWTCGLTDGGLHNLFLDEEQLWMFDLGEPTLEPIPAFLTKFLMSFFHTLGMEEDEKGDWVVRFEQDDSGKLRLTEQTKELLPKVMEAFNITMDRLIKELFGGDEDVRLLMLRYVAIQLISDAAFCIEKWRTKGGGDELRSEHQDHLQKWLWRALWDVYVSEELRRRYITRTLFRKQNESRDLMAMN
ncbi:predicted protein [Thalassiosira pseudonana CCMP1335]|uniref:Uncharacterized protein n=1 Tax=Thalassiosira pseudonana TaxID=35128 RepID=B8CDS9_THAPS|nr:predicted protein [Thalassiosira pseudonana CCMP1335]EED88668.1 predicted protein [Thalassiosira pseudonana CCMP1335]